MIERVRAAAEAGFTGVEMLFPYDLNAQELRDECVINGVQMVLINCPPPNYTGGEQGWAAVPALQDRFRRDFNRVLRYASVLKPQILQIMPGIASGPEAEACLIENLTWAAEQAPKQRLTLKVISDTAIPGYFLNSYDLAARVLDAANAPNLGLQLDTFHAHQITGDASAAWQAHAGRVTHIQVGHGETRHEPTNAPFDHPSFFKELKKSRYSGWISGEYNPAQTTVQGLNWIK